MPANSRTVSGVGQILPGITVSNDTPSWYQKPLSIQIDFIQAAHYWKGAVLNLHNPKSFATHKATPLYQCVFPSGAIPQSHAVIRSSGEEEEAVCSEAESVHSAIVSRVHW